MAVARALHFNRPISVYRFPRRALTLCPQLCMGIQPGARCPARSADALPATLYGHFAQAIYRNRPISSVTRLRQTLQGVDGREDLRGVRRGLHVAKAQGPRRYCSPRHPMRFKPLFLELNRTLLPSLWASNFLKAVVW
jgi:hypothetical protein